MEQILLGLSAGETDAKQINPRQTRMRTWGVGSLCSSLVTGSRNEGLMRPALIKLLLCAGTQTSPCTFSHFILAKRLGKVERHDQGHGPLHGGVGLELMSA